MTPSPTAAESAIDRFQGIAIRTVGWMCTLSPILAPKQRNIKHLQPQKNGRGLSLNSGQTNIQRIRPTCSRRLHFLALRLAATSISDMSLTSPHTRDGAPDRYTKHEPQSCAPQWLPSRNLAPSSCDRACPSPPTLLEVCLTPRAEWLP